MPVTAAGSTAAYYGIRAMVTIATVRPWRFSLPCDLDLWLFDLWVKCIPSDYYRVYVYQVWCR